MSANEMTVEALLRAHAPHAPESLRARVLALEPKERRLSLPSRRLLLVALPAAVGVAVSVAVIHGIVGSGSKTPTVAAARFSPVVTTPSWGSAGVGSGGIDNAPTNALPATARKS